MGLLDKIVSIVVDNMSGSAENKDLLKQGIDLLSAQFLNR